ncbi:hypothetical protein V5O48_015311 [Marasmius crinis-equi]|uniref:Uncharacterized protein n=1 Tax=Marasmius crinis-equi TaxID=585013 RepID=A0ABR3EUW1_9AGAR
MGSPRALRLLKKDAGGIEDEELVFTVQGALAKKELPPIDKPLSQNTRLALLSQYISLCGLGSEVFDDAVKGLEIVEDQFRRNLDDNEMTDHVIVGAIRQHQTIDLANRYVTCKNATNGSAEVELDNAVDPNGHIAKLILREDGKYVRTEENVVEFYERTRETDGRWSYVRLNPKKFKVGDIVEAQFSLSCVSLGHRHGNKWRMVGILRCLTLLDGSFTEAAVKAKREADRSEREAKTAKRKTISAQAKAGPVKRRVGYEGQMGNNASMT